MLSRSLRSPGATRPTAGDRRAGLIQPGTGENPAGREVTLIFKALRGFYGRSMSTPAMFLSRRVTPSWIGGSAKSLESEPRTLAADVLAVRTVLAHVLGRICQLDPILAEAIQNGFEDAVDKIRKTAAKSRTRMTSHQVVEALAAVEALRAVLSNRSDNRGHPSVANDNK
jgi:hypothetical protein